MRNPVRPMSVSWLPLIVLAAFAIALACAPVRAAAADDEKDWKILGELKIKDGFQFIEKNDSGPTMDQLDTSKVKK